MTERKRADLDWEDLRVFLALGRHGTLSGAARALGVNHATVARRVRSLEASLGEKLVDRRSDGYVLTPAGTRTLSAASSMEGAAGTLGRPGGDDAPKGLVRVNAPPALAQGYLVGRLATASVEQPGLDIDLGTDLRAVSLERRETDLAIRLARPPDGDVVARRLATVGYGYYAASPVREAIAKGADPVFVGFDEANAGLPEALWLFRHFPGARMSFRTHNQIVQAMAAKVGAGVALLPHYLGRGDPDLHICDGYPAPSPRELWLLMRPQDRAFPPIQYVAERLQQVFKRDSALFEGL